MARGLHNLFPQPPCSDCNRSATRLTPTHRPRLARPRRPCRRALSGRCKATALTVRLLTLPNTTSSRYPHQAFRIPNHPSRPNRHRLRFRSLRASLLSLPLVRVNGSLLLPAPCRFNTRFRLCARLCPSPSRRRERARCRPPRQLAQRGQAPFRLPVASPPCRHRLASPSRRSRRKRNRRGIGFKRRMTLLGLDENRGLLRTRVPTGRVDISSAACTLAFWALSHTMCCTPAFVHFAISSLHQPASPHSSHPL